MSLRIFQQLGDPNWESLFEYSKAPLAYGDRVKRF